MERGLDLRMTASHCLSVFVGCPHSPTQLPAGPCLVVNSEAIDQNEWLSEESLFTHRNLRSDERLITIDETVITAYDQELVEWHIFSDDRFNGPWELSDFTDQFPNLRLRSFKTIKGVTLYTILNKQKTLADPFSTYQLFIRQGDPLIILQSAGEWLVRCVSISLHGLICSPSTYASCEAYLRLCGFCQSDVDSSVWHPHFEKSAFHLSLIRYCLLALFNADAYRELHPEMKDKREDELMNHWLMQPNYSEIADEMQKTIRNQLDQDGLLALFNADAYRELYPEIKDKTDSELMNHWLIQPDYHEISKIIYDYVRCQPVQLSELTDKDPALKLILHTFPFNFYRKIRPDLSDIPDKDLIIHFWKFGRHEDVDLSENYVHNFLLDNSKKDNDLQVKTLTARVRELENLLSLANAQICSMQELIVRSQNIGVINE